MGHQRRAVQPHRDAMRRLQIADCRLQNETPVTRQRAICDLRSAICNRRSGVVLLAVLIVIVVLTLSAYLFSNAMLEEYRGTDSYARAAQARALAESGIDYAAAILSNPDTFTNTLNSNPFSNPLFQHITVQESRNPRLQGRLSIVAPLGPDDAASESQPYRFGVTDECGKINLN